MHVPLREFLKNWDAMLDKEFVGKGPFAQEAVAFLGVATEDRKEGGVVIKEVGDKTPAADAGLQKGDVILSLNGNAVDGAQQFSASLAGFKPGQKVKLKILRDDEEQEIEVELGEK